MIDIDPDAEREVFLTIFPHHIQDVIQNSPCRGLNEIVLDLGYPPEIRWDDGSERLSDGTMVTQGEIDEVIRKIGRFNGDNRAGIERTLHRISGIRNREGKVIGLTCRMGRSIVGALSELQDIIRTKKNILLLGPPGVGKTTKLREFARVMSMELKRRVIVVDTSNEIAGDGDIPHSGIGFARRMQVPSPTEQHRVMIEAVENHMPQVVIVDEIGTLDEALAARTIAERGIQLIATAHGYTLENLIKNPTLSDLIGGIQSVILGDDEAKLRGTQKTVLERRNAPTFDVIIEIREKDLVAIYKDSRTAVDSLLRGERISPELRRKYLVSEPLDQNSAALIDAKKEIDDILVQIRTSDIAIDGTPRTEEARRFQHRHASQSGFNSVDIGPENYRFIRVFPNQ